MYLQRISFLERALLHWRLQRIFIFLIRKLSFRIDLPSEVSLFAEPLAIAIRAADRARMKAGQTTVIHGTGAVGLLTLMCAKAPGPPQ